MKIDPLVQLAASAPQGEQRYIVFAGAGLSRDANVPTAWELAVEMVRPLYISDVDPDGANASHETVSDWLESSPYNQMSFSEITEAIFGSNQGSFQDFFRSKLECHPYGMAHELIAQLVKLGITRTIVTTNFDKLIEKALTAQNIEFEVVTKATDYDSLTPLIHVNHCRIYKPHGSLGIGNLKVTTKDLFKLEESVEDELTRLFSEHGMIVIGYSGDDKGMQTIISNRRRNLYPIFWFMKDKPNHIMHDILDIQETRYINTSSARHALSKFIELSNNLHKIRPGTIIEPTLHDIEMALGKVYDPSVGAFHKLFDNIEFQVNSVRENTVDNVSEFVQEQISQLHGYTVHYTSAFNMAVHYMGISAMEVCFRRLGALAAHFVGTENDDGKLDYIRYFVHEVFLISIALLLKQKEYQLIDEFLGASLGLRGDIQLDEDWEYILQPRKALDCADRSIYELPTSRLIMKNRIKDIVQISQLSFNDVCDADILLFIRSISKSNILCGKRYWNCITGTWAVDLPAFAIDCHNELKNEVVSMALGYPSFVKMQKQFADDLESYKEHNAQFLHRNIGPLNIAEQIAREVGET